MRKPVRAAAGPFSVLEVSGTPERAESRQILEGFPEAALLSRVCGVGRRTHGVQDAHGPGHSGLGDLVEGHRQGTVGSRRGLRPGTDLRPWRRTREAGQGCGWGSDLRAGGQLLGTHLLFGLPAGSASQPLGPQAWWLGNHPSQGPALGSQRRGVASSLDPVWSPEYQPPLQGCTKSGAGL